MFNVLVVGLCRSLVFVGIAYGHVGLVSHSGSTARTAFPGLDDVVFAERRDGCHTDGLEGIDDVLRHLDGAVAAADSEERFAVADLHVQEGEVQKSEYGSGDEDLDDAEAGQIAKHFFA